MNPGLLAARKRASGGGRTLAPSIAHISSGILSNITANTARSATVSVTAGTMLVCVFAQECTTANTNPAVTSVTASGLTFTRLGNFIGVGNSNLANAQSIEVWATPITITNSALSVSWQYSAAIDDATYSFESVTNYGSVGFANIYTQAVTSSQSITYSIPDHALALGVAASAISTTPSLTGFTSLANTDNAGGNYWENSQTAYITTGATPVSNATASAGPTDSVIILIGIILGK